ncbi:PAQR family membrane homeostasis protein TrhA [Leifsonia sp. RAF41]|uniref:PAQR family membrane homeostasis protein TrhA n=1 Tax=Leifsonia sp. RAF41 TaxID=3233056 RepID=UPI003F96DAE1
MSPRNSTDPAQPDGERAGARAGEDVAELLREPTSALDASDAAVQADEREARDRGQELPNIPLLDASPADPGEVKPTWRGWIHAGTFPVTVVSGIALISLAHGAPAKWASAVFMVTSMLLFGNSALYHRFDWRPRMKVLLKRIDHANIFLLIAGTYTPLAVLALPPSKGILLLCLVWAGALLGIAFRVFWINAPRWLYVPLYVALGWAAMMYIVDLFNANAAMMVLVIVGGILYTIGAVIYGMKRPNPFPGRFGFHEIFHTLTVLAFLCHWTAVLLIAMDPAYNVG